jgi:hypothetical protein
VDEADEALRRSLRLQLFVTPSQKVRDLLPNDAAQFYYFRAGLPPHGMHLCVGYPTATASRAHSFLFHPPLFSW